MKSILGRLTMLLATLFSLSLLWLPFKPLFAATGTIAGTVTGTDGKPAPGITVNVYYHSVSDWYDDWYWSTSTTTDENGHYAIDVETPATYRLGFSDNNYPQQYASQFYLGVQDVYSAQDINVSDGATAQIDIQLSKYATISGRITDEAGNPLPYGTYVQLYREDIWGWGSINSAGTDGDGNYIFYGLTDGKYRISIQDSNQSYKLEWYNNALSLEEATDIEILNGVDVTNIDAQLAKRGSISGTVTFADGTPVSGIDIAVYRYPATEGDATVSYTATDMDGHYEARGLDSGEYVVSFTCFVDYYYVCNPELYNDAASLQSATPVTVADGQVTPNIDAQVTKLGRITGTVTDPNNNPVSSIHVIVGQPSEYGFQGQTYDGYTNELGQYEIGNLRNGNYVVYFDVNDNYVPEYYNNKPDIATADLVSVSADAVTSGVDAQLSPYGEINGTIRDRRGNPIENASVTLYLFNEYGNWEGIRTTQTNISGNYKLQGVRPGSYRIGAAGSSYYSSSSKYVTSFYPNANTVETGRDIAVGMSEVLTGIDLVLGDVGMITGKVTNILGEPLADVQVQTFYVVYDMGSYWSVYSQSNTTLESSGVYTLNAHSNLAVPVRICFEPPFPYHKECYDDVPQLDTAKDITVAANSILSGIDAVIDFSTEVKVPPIARSDAISVTRGGSTSQLADGSRSLLANDFDPDSPAVLPVIVDNPEYGTVLIQSNGTFTYTHDSSAVWSDFFTYKNFDGDNSSNIVTVTVTVLPMATFEFSKTVGIQGIEPTCGAVGEMKVPLTTTIVYCYSIFNRGDVTYTTHSLFDDKLGLLFEERQQELAPNSEMSVQFTQTLSISTTNVATWTATTGGALLTSADFNAPADANHVLIAHNVQQATIQISSASDDQDGDTIPDNIESAGDADGDNVPNFLDTDSNGNNTPDVLEVGADVLHPRDSNHNGIPDYLDLTPTADAESAEPTQTKVYLPLVER